VVTLTFPFLSKTMFMLRLRSLLVGWTLCLLASCQFLPHAMEPMPKRDESFSYYGPGSERVVKGSLTAATFAEDSALLNDSAIDAVESLLDKLAEDPRRHVLLAGFANDSGTAEFNRVLGEERAQAVRRALLAKGVPTARIHTVSYGNEMDSRSGELGRRVELGIVEPAVP
jgi:peptidoglycan-associated lipoprotein